MDGTLGGDFGKAAVCTEKEGNRLPLYLNLLSSGSSLTCPGSFTPEQSRAEDLIHGGLHFKQERTEAFASL